MEVCLKPYPMVAASLPLVLALVAPLGAQKIDDATRRAVQAELNAFFDQYYEWYSAGSADEISRHAYSAPFQLSNGTSLETQADVRNWVSEAWARLDTQGYGRSQMPERNICVLNNGAAFVSGRGIRYRKDGSVFGEYGWTYTVVKTADGWRIVSIFGHDPGLAVRC